MLHLSGSYHTDNASGQVQAEYLLSHIAHEQRLGHMRMSDELRQKIAGKLACKVPIDAILDEILDNLMI